MASYLNYDDISSDEYIDDVDINVNPGKVRTSRPPRSVLYYLKAYDSWLSLTPIQLPPRSRIIQVLPMLHVKPGPSSIKIFSSSNYSTVRFNHS